MHEFTSARAIAHVELGHGQQKVKTEKLKVIISNALEESLGLPTIIPNLVLMQSTNGLTYVFPVYKYGIP